MTQVELSVPLQRPAMHLSSYPIIQCTTPTSDDKAKANREAMLELIQQLGDNLQWATGQGKAKYQIQHTVKRGMLLARDRIASVLDEGSPFLELSALAGLGWDDSTPWCVLIAALASAFLNSHAAQAPSLASASSPAC